MPELDLQFVDEAIARLGNQREAVIPLLQAIQGHYRYLPREAVERVCAQTEITPAEITGVSTFLHAVPPSAGGEAHHQRLPRDGLPREGGGSGARRAGTAASSPKRRGHRTRRAIHAGEGRLPGLLHAGAGDSDRRRHLRPSDARDGRRGAARFPRTSPKRRASIEPRNDVRPSGELGEIRIGLGSCCVAQGSGQGPRADRASAGRSPAPRRGETRGLRGDVPSDAAGRVGPARRQGETLFAESTPRTCPAIVCGHFKPQGRARGVSAIRCHGWLDRLASDETGDPVARHAHRHPRSAGVRVPRAAEALGHRVLRPDRSDRTSTSICATTVFARCGAASRNSRREDHRRDQAQRAARPRRRGLSHRARNGPPSARPRER